MAKQRGRTAEYICKYHRCREHFTARVADRNRGWALYCSKRCKALAQQSMQGWPDCRKYYDTEIFAVDPFFEKHG